MLAISGPSMLIAWLKLRQRSLGPLLDASGWAINGRMRINVPLGGTLTESAQACRRGPSAGCATPTSRRRTGPLLWLLAAVTVGALVVAWRLGLLGNPMPG